MSVGGENMKRRKKKGGKVKEKRKIKRKEIYATKEK
jgi:hypothetical protein